jgi:hypothetical protein
MGSQAILAPARPPRGSRRSADEHDGTERRHGYRFATERIVRLPFVLTRYPREPHKLEAETILSA